MRKNCGNEKKDKDKNKVNWRNKGRKLTYISRKVQDKVKEAKKIGKRTCSFNGDENRWK